MGLSPLEHAVPGANRRAEEPTDNDGVSTGSTTCLNKRVVALSSCTAAIHLALLQLGVSRDEEVLCQSFSFCASTIDANF